MDHYSIEIKLQPEVLGKELMYFWHIIKNEDGNASNCGHGWSKSVEHAAMEGYQYYMQSS